VPAKPGDEITRANAGLGWHVPEFSSEPEPAVMIEAEIIHRTVHDLFWMVAEAMIHRNAGIVRNLRAALRDEFVHIQVVRGRVFVGLRAIGTQDHARRGVVGQDTIDVWMRAPELGFGARLRL